MPKKADNGKHFSLMIILGICCCAIFAFIVVSIIAASSKSETERNIQSYLEIKEIDYSSVNIEDKLLTVKLNSSGTGYCTLNDVKAIQAIYEAIHGDNIIENVEDISIYIYDTEGSLIYDLYRPGVSKPVESIKNVSIAEAYDTLMPEDAVNLIVEESPFKVKTMNFSSARQIDGRKLELSVESEASSFNDLQTLYRKLETYSLSSNEISQCAISVEKDGECVLYMAGDFKYGNCISWVSPEMREPMVSQVTMERVG